MKNLLLILILLSSISAAKSNNLADSSKISFFIDGKRVSVLSLQSLQDSAKIDYLGGQSHPSFAITEYGEKYRTGVIFFKSTDSAPLYCLNGTINPFHNGEQIMLFQRLGDSILSVDTTRIEQGRFTFRGAQNLFTDIAILMLGNYPDPVTTLDVILEAGTIQVNMDSLTASGTALNDRYRNFLKNKASAYTKLNQLWEKDNRQAYVIGSDLYRARTDYENLQVNTIKSNISNPIGYRIFQTYCSALADRDLAAIDSLFPKPFKPVTLIAEEWARRKRNSEYSQKQWNLNGTQFADFELLTTSGAKQKLSDIVRTHDYTYLDFWASWCGPCRAEIPHLKQLYEKYRSKNIEFVGLSMDTTMPVWKRSLTEVDAPWLHLSDLKGMHSAMTEAYHVLGIPAGFLIDKSGIIVKVCRADDLDVELKKRFPNL